MTEIRIQSTRGGCLRLRHGLGWGWQWNGQAHDEDVFVTETQPGNRWCCTQEVRKIGMSTVQLLPRSDSAEQQLAFR
jgi:hypothetical protein